MLQGVTSKREKPLLSRLKEQWDEIRQKEFKMTIRINFLTVRTIDVKNNPLEEVT